MKSSLAGGETDQVVLRSLGKTLCYKFGYGSDFETFKKEARDKFSLINDGTLDIPGCARLLLVNVSLTPFPADLAVIHANADGTDKPNYRVPRTASSQSTTTTSLCSTATLRKLGE